MLRLHHFHATTSVHSSERPVFMQAQEGSAVGVDRLRETDWPQLVEQFSSDFTICFSFVLDAAELRHEAPGNLVLREDSVMDDCPRSLHEWMGVALTRVTVGGRTNVDDGPTIVWHVTEELVAAHSLHGVVSFRPFLDDEFTALEVCDPSAISIPRGEVRHDFVGELGGESGWEGS